MKKIMWLCTFICATAALASGIGYSFTSFELLEILMISSATALYHFAMRLIVGTIVDKIFQNKFDHTLWWFRKRSFEDKFYKRLKVNSWKKKMPTYEAGLFDVKEHSTDELLGAKCQAEVVHELIVLLSFVPLFFSLWWGTFFVFLITSVLAAMYDSCFVMIQRYNRPRVERLLARKRSSNGLNQDK